CRLIGGLLAARYEAHAGAAGSFAVGLSHHRRAAFLPADDNGDVRGIVECIEHRQIAFSRHTKYAIDAVRTQGANEDFATTEQLLFASHDYRSNLMPCANGRASP